MNDIPEEGDDNPLPVKRIFSHCAHDEVPVQQSLIYDLLMLNGWKLNSDHPLNAKTDNFILDGNSLRYTVLPRKKI